MHFLFMYLSSIVANKGILTYKEKTSYDLCESYLIDNLDYYNNFSAYSERLWAKFFKQKKNDGIKSTLMSLIPLYNYIYCSLRYPDIEDEYLERAEELFNKIKSKIKNASVTTDIIVGFPGETKEDFEETLDVVEKCKYDGAYTFIYSPRENTPAAKMEDNVSLEEKEERLATLNKLVNKYYKENNEKLLNTVVPVLIEGVSEKNEDLCSGYTDTMKLVNVKCSKDYIGKIINVKITEAKTWSLDGVINE